MTKRLFSNQWLVFVFTLILFYFTQNILNRNLGLSNATLKQLSNYVSQSGLISLLNNPLFWSSGLGNSLKLAMEVFLTSCFLYIAARLFNHVAGWKKYMITVSLSQLIFLLQYIIEFIYIKKHPSVLVRNNQQTFSFLSIKHLFNYANIQVPHYFEHASQTLGLFEVLFWVLLSWFLSKFTTYSLKSCVLIVLSGYVTVLLSWLLLISFLLLLNS